MADTKHLEILHQGVESWNNWRNSEPEIRPDLSKAVLTGINLCGANLSGADLSFAHAGRADFSNANLSGADLQESYFVQSDFHKANLRGAKLGMARLWDGVYLVNADMRGADLNRASLVTANLAHADLRGACLTRAELSDANLSYADLTGASLFEARLIRTNMEWTILVDCNVYGISAWDVKLEGAKQLNMAISRDDSSITVDNLEVAQFLYLLLNRERLRSVLDTITSKAVLLLGRFTPERKAVLDALAVELRKRNLVPIIFDFEKVDQRSFTETIKILAGMSKFVIADITNPKSSPLELQAIVPDYMVPFVPILQEGEQPFSMFVDLQNQYSWVMKVKKYRCIEQLLEKMERAIIEPAIKMHAELQLKKAQGIQQESLDDY